MAKVPARVFVFPVKGREAEIATLKKLITQAGCNVVCDKAKPADYEKCVKAADVLVILLCPETQNDIALNNLITLASREGKRVVGVWLPGVQNLELPDAVNKHGDAAISLDVESIRKSICGAASVWTTPDGGPRPTPKTPRHKG